MAEMNRKTCSKPLRLAVIREAECIGCTKCIQACPADAILGSLNQMHTVIAEECIGCDLCVAPCPVDCIDMIDAEIIPTSSIRQERAAHFRKRYHARKIRLQEPAIGKIELPLLSEKKSYIQAALERAKLKKY
jgi:electron transport complex protein RnfB